MSEVDEVGVRLTLYERAKFARDFKDSEDDVKRFTKTVREQNAEIKAMGKEYERSRDPLQQFTRDARNSFRDLRNDVSGLNGAIGNLYSGFQSIAHSNLVQYGLGGVTLGFTAAAGAATYFGLQTTNSLEQANVAFTKFLGSGKASQDYIAQLKTFAATTPFNFESVVPSAQRLLNTGDDQAKSLVDLRAIGDAAAGADPIEGQQGFDRIALAISQVKRSPFAHAQDFNQLVQANIDPYGMIAQATGKTAAQVQTDVSGNKIKGSSAAEILLQGFEKQYGGLMDAQSHTLGGQLSNLHDTAAFGLADATKPLAELLERNMPTISRGVGILTTDFGKMLDSTIKFGQVLGVAFVHDGMDGMLLKLGDITGTGDKLDVIWKHIYKDSTDIARVWRGSLYPDIKDVAEIMGPFVYMTLKDGEAILHWMADHPDAARLLFDGIAISLITYGTGKLIFDVVTGVGKLALAFVEAGAAAQLWGTETAAATALADGSLALGATGGSKAAFRAGATDAAAGGGLLGGASRFLKSGAGRVLGGAGAAVGGWELGSYLYDHFIPDPHKINQDGGTYSETMTGIQRPPGAANGANVTREGVLRVGEEGPELLRLGPPAQVQPLDTSGSAKAGTTVIFQAGAIVLPVADYLNNKALTDHVLNEIETRIAHE